MALAAGTPLGPYQIIAPLGSGGMGEVYRAVDTRLQRAVAIKIIPEHVSNQPGARERFMREAQLVSGLNHPHICVVHDIGRDGEIDYFVMELLEGESLAERIGRGPLPPDEVARLASQLADALHRAHRAGVVHRDVKPANIMLTRGGVKVVDFGLARLSQATIVDAEVSAAPTQPGLTAAGTILGTLQYMAPEQLEGRETDNRTDIFALGAVMYEMLTGRKPFDGSSQASLIAAIMGARPPMPSSLQPLITAEWDRIITRCFAKDPDDRWQSAGDVAHEIKWLAENTNPRRATTEPAGTPFRTMSLPAWRAATAILATALPAAIAVAVMRPLPAPQVAARFHVAPPDGWTFDARGRRVPIGMISPDGRRLTFAAKNAEGLVALWLRPIDALVARQIPGTEGAYQPFWSPDSRSIGFFTADGQLRRVDSEGGLPQTICDAPDGRGGTWNRDGVIVFARARALHRVSQAGGEPVELSRGSGLRVGAIHSPSFLPDGRHVLFLGDSPEYQGVYVQAVDSDVTVRLVESDTGAVYAAPGFLLFGRGGRLLAQRFDVSSREVTGEPVPIAEQVESATAGGAVLAFSVSDGGTLAYGVGGNTSELRRLVWLDRTGKLLETIGPPAYPQGVDLSPDGLQIVAHHHTDRGGDVWMTSVTRGTTSRLTYDETQHNISPIWAGDGGQVVFSSHRGGKWHLFVKPVATAGPERLLVESETIVNPMSSTPDGRAIAFARDGDLWMVSLSDGGNPERLTTTPFGENFAQLSPKGRWVAYTSSESGSAHVYVRQLRSDAVPIQVSVSPGRLPRWRADERELFYLEGGEDETYGRVMAVDVDLTGTTPKLGQPRWLFDSLSPNMGGHLDGGGYHVYAVSPDGQRFLFQRYASNVAGDYGSGPIAVVMDWTAILPDAVR